MDTETKALTRNTYPVTGMHCAACVASVESILKAQEGVKSASVNYAGAKVTVEYDEETISPEEMQEAVRSIGYDLITGDRSSAQEQTEKAQNEELKRLKRDVFWSIGLSAPIVVIAMVFPDLPYGRYIMWALATPVLFVFGNSFFINAFKRVRKGQVNMDTLVAMSTGTAYLFSAVNIAFRSVMADAGIEAHVYFEAAAVIIAFILLGRYLEGRAKSGASQAISKLLSLQPAQVTIRRSGGEHEEIPAAEVQVGDEILVRPGERIAVDGEVIEGKSYVDESAISGEPMPVLKTEGEEVYSGTINQKGSFHFRAAKVGEDTLLSRIVKAVEEAQGSKAPVQRLADKVASVFVPVVVGIAIISMVAWIIFAGDNSVTKGILAFVTVLIIACPCALGLATPTALTVGIGKGAEIGILIKDAVSLEKAENVDTVIFDKTGTITMGEPTVEGISWFVDESDRQQLRNILFSIEDHSEHPLAEAITNYLRDDAEMVLIKNFESVTGKGVTADVRGRKYAVGNRPFIEDRGVKIPGDLLKDIPDDDVRGVGQVFFTDDEHVIALVRITDEINSTAQEAVETLRSMDIEVILASGDVGSTTERTAETVGIDRVYADALPEDKSELTNDLRSEGRTVAFVGDGINDAPALASADVSIALGRGTDIAIEVASITIMSSDLKRIPQALKLSARTMRVIRQNLFWAFIYNIIGIPIAAGVLYPFFGFLLNPMIAGAAMALSSVSVVTNSLRLKYMNN